jgi:hypothetical protein
MNAQVAAVDNAALQGFLLRRIPPTSEWKLRAEAPGELHLPMHQKATGVNPWMNGFRCRVPLHGKAEP